MEGSKQESSFENTRMMRAMRSEDFGQAIVFRDEKRLFKYVLKVGLPGISKILDTYYEKKVILE